MHKKTAVLRACVFAPLMAVGLLVGCGGGGGAAPPTLTGTILGLAPNGVLELRVNGQAQSFSTTIYANQMPLSFSRAFSAGESYSIDVQKHPVGQICAVLRSASGKLDSSVSDVRVECHTTRLNDTGIAGSTTTQTSALAPDSQAGRDAEVARLTKVGAGAQGFDYTKVCTGGREVDAVGACPTGESWDCVRDNVTGLMWRRSDVAYSGAAPVSTDSQCGRTNWRAPTVHEMLSVVHAGKSAAPFVDADYFGVAAAPFFTSETYLDGSGNPWAVDLSNAGAVGLYTPGGTELRRALWVSGTSALNDPLSSAYTKTDISSQFVIIDTSRELMWLVPKTLVDGDWAGAVASVATVNAAVPGGYGDWRLPNRSELDALVNRSRKLPAMDPVVGSAIADPLNAVTYWSSSPYVASPSSNAWVVDFSYGDISVKLKTTNARYIYVRNRAFNNAQ